MRAVVLRAWNGCEIYLLKSQLTRRLIRDASRNKKSRLSSIHVHGSLYCWFAFVWRCVHSPELSLAIFHRPCRKRSWHLVLSAFILFIRTYFVRSACQWLENCLLGCRNGFFSPFSRLKRFVSWSLIQEIGGALMSAPPQAMAPNPHTNMVNVYIQIANKIGFQKKIFGTASTHILTTSQFTSRYHQTTGDWDVCPPDLKCKCSSHIVVQVK
jgi:hypothetical protein